MNIGQYFIPIEKKSKDLNKITEDFNKWAQLRGTLQRMTQHIKLQEYTEGHYPMDHT